MNVFDVTPTLRPSHYGPSDALAGEHDTDMIVTVQLRSGTPHRFGLGFVSADGHARRDAGGPVLPGPYAYAYGLPTCVSINGGTGAEMRAARAAGNVIDAELGDVLIFQGSFWRIDRDRNDNLKLVQVALTATATEIPAPTAHNLSAMINVETAARDLS
jgi:hypothetical protein